MEYLRFLTGCMTLVWCLQLIDVIKGKKQKTIGQFLSLCSAWQHLRPRQTTISTHNRLYGDRFQITMSHQKVLKLKQVHWAIMHASRNWEKIPERKWDGV